MTGHSIVCQLARMGDLVQTLPLLEVLKNTGPVTLICDEEVQEWGKLLPGIEQYITINTKYWREKSTRDQLPLSHLLYELADDLQNFASLNPAKFYVLNDHPVADILASSICGSSHEKWLTEELILLRAYIRSITSQRRWNRIHLADLWRSLRGTSSEVCASHLAVPASGMQFAKTTLRSLQQAGTKRIWAFILGSGGKYRRLTPEYFSSVWNNIAEYGIGLLLIGGRGEEELGKRFLQTAHNGEKKVLNLVGKCSPGELLGVFASINLVVGVDTGPLHWAAAVGTKVLGIYFGDAGFYDTGTYGSGHWVLAPDCGDYPCHPEYAKFCGYRCVQMLNDPKKLAALLLTFDSEKNQKDIPIPAGFRLFRSFLSPAGQMVQEIMRENDQILEPELAAVRRIFRLESPSMENLNRSEQVAEFDLFKRWRREIEDLTIGGRAPNRIVREVKVKALKRLPQQRQRAFLPTTKDSVKIPLLEQQYSIADSIYE